MSQQDHVSYLVFDVEAIADGDLIRRVKYADEAISERDAITRYEADLVREGKSGVFAPTFMRPISVCVAKVDRDYRLQDIIALDHPTYAPERIVEKFWTGWKHYGQPTFVTFNGRGYDMPVMEIGAFRGGLSVPEWFNPHGRNYEQPRYPYNVTSHIDLMDLFSNFGAMRITGGLNLMANLIGKPGKTGVDGSDVQAMYDRGEIREINDYCRCDVLDTYFVFLRSRVMIGDLPLEIEQERVLEAKAWLEERRGQNEAYEHYLTRWGDWKDRQKIIATENAAAL